MKKLCTRPKCVKPATWIVVVPHNEEPRIVCRRHLTVTISEVHEEYRETTTDLTIGVKRW